jgi:polysaccharide pyruvyl transferase WcaK-like protein
VLLVPHVAPLNGDLFNNDESFNRKLMQVLGGPTTRLAQVPDGLNSAQLKHVISQCRFLIGGRTHATIAGFSSAVPTLSIAYSVKAKGINRDLFGDERYVLETPRLSRGTLWAGLELLQQDEVGIRERYYLILPTWRERAHAGAYRLAELLNEARG